MTTTATPTDWQALCSRLLAALKTWSPDGGGPLEGAEKEYEAALIAEADAALVQPEPQGPTIEEPRLLAVEWGHRTPEEFASIVRRWGCPVIKPVPVSERLPGPEQES